MKLYVIKDNLQDYESAIYSFTNDDSARRAIPMLVEHNPLMSRYPNDFSLYRVGEFNFESGHIDSENTPVFICSMAERRENDMA